MTRSDSAPQGQTFTHQLQAESTQRFAVHVNAEARAVYDYLLALKAAQVIRQIPPLSATVLTVMLTELDPDQLPRLVVACSYRWLAEHTGRSPGHLQRQIAAMEVAGLIAVLRHGGRSQDTPNVYELLEQHAPAQQVNARRRANLNHALARGYGGPARKNARRRAKKVLRLRAEFAPTEDINSAAALLLQRGGAPAREDQPDPDQDQAAAANAERLRKATVAGKPAGLDEAAIAHLAHHPHCTPEQIRVAIARAEELSRRGKLRSTPAQAIYAAIVNRWAAPLTAAERRQAAKPEHVQEGEAVARQERAAADARERAIDAALAAMTAEQVRELQEAAADQATPGPHRSAILRARAPVQLASVRELVYARLQQLQTKPAAGVAVRRAGERNPDAVRD